MCHNLLPSHFSSEAHFPFSLKGPVIYYLSGRKGLTDLDLLVCSLTLHSYVINMTTLFSFLSSLLVYSLNYSFKNNTY